MTIDELKRLESKATGRPWNPIDIDEDTTYEASEDDERKLFWSVCSQHGECCADCPREDYPLHCHECVTPGAYVSEENARFIASLRNAAPALFEALEYVASEVDGSDYSYKRERAAAIVAKFEGAL